MKQSVFGLKRFRRVCFNMSTLIRFHSTARDFSCVLSTLVPGGRKMRDWERGYFRFSFTLQPPKTLMETKVYGTFFQRRFLRPPFSPVHSVSNGAFSRRYVFKRLFFRNVWSGSQFFFTVRYFFTNHKNYNFSDCDLFTKTPFFPLIRSPSCYRTVH